MKKSFFVIALAIVCTVPSFAQRQTYSSTNDRLVNASDSISFALGFGAGRTFADRFGVDLNDELNFDVFRRAFEQAIAGGSDWLDENKLESYVRDYYTAKRRAMYAGNIEAGERFLAENRLDPDVVETASGLQYRVVQMGRDPGDRPRPYDDMHITYTGRTIDGTTVTSGDDEYSYPASENDGLEEGTQLMSPGAKYIFYVPADLAYGEDGQDLDEGKVPPYSVLIYEVYMDSMTRDHSYYDEAEGTVVDMDTWSAENSSGSQDDSQPIVRQAGDYTATTLANIPSPIEWLEGDDIVKTYQTDGYTIATTQDRVIVLDPDGREILRNPLDEDDNSYDSYYLTRYSADDGAGPIFFVLDFGFDGGSYFGSMLYVIEGGQFYQTDKYLALVNDEGGSERLTPILTLHRDGLEVMFRFDSDELKFDPIGESITVEGEDFWYVFRGGQITEAGPVTALSSFRNR